MGKEMELAAVIYNLCYQMSHVHCMVRATATVV
jgi:hypothetical protein